jgi:hypothetical protein
MMRLEEIFKEAIDSREENNRDILIKEGATPVVIDDPSDTWSHGVLKFKNETGRFSNATVRILEKGPIRGVLVRVKVDWHERHRMLKLKFPVNLKDPKVTYQIPCFDYVVTVCDQAKETCPYFPGARQYIHRNFEDPSTFSGSDEEIMEKVRKTRDEIKNWIIETFGE